MDLLFSGNIDGAVAELESLIVEHPLEKDAYRGLGDIYRTHDRDTDKAIASYRKVIDIDPMDKFAYNVLAYTYQAIGDIDNYIWAIYQYMALAPDEANPYDSRADLYAFSGNLEKAIDSYNDALERKPDFYPSVGKLGKMQLFKKDFEAATGYFEQFLASDDKDTRAWGRLLMVFVPLFKGKLDEAVEVAQAGIASDRAENYGGEMLYWKGILTAVILAEKGQYGRAIELTEKWLADYRALNPDDPVSASDVLINLVARSGDIEWAETLLAELKANIERVDKSRMKAYWRAKGDIEMAKENYDAAVESFAQGAFKWNDFNSDYQIALCYLKSGRAIEAVNEFERNLRGYSESRAQSPLEAVRAFYYLGIAHEESGHGEKAVEWYEEFLDYWGNADAELVEVEDAKQRLAALKQTG
jgi:tetratricopeptide (TPR) repeat protein